MQCEEIEIDLQGEYLAQMAIRRSVIREAETNRGMPPTKSDIDETMELLNDFGITRRIPKFSTYKELEAWRNALVRGCVKGWQ